MVDTVVPHTLDEYFQTTPVGSIERAMGNNLFGINQMQTPGAVPSNKDMYGLTFLTRPQLNLQSDNIRNFRYFYNMLNNNMTSIQRYVRCTLDPRIMYGYPGIPSIPCPLVDPLQAFIPVLTNNLNSVSGWPDLTSPTFTSKEGLYQEAYSQVDGIVKNYTTYDLDLTFRNTRGDPIVFMFYVWLHYMSAVFEGNLMPYPDFLVHNRLDYNTRIYRLVLDQERRVVTKITATGVAYPINLPLGQFFDYSSERPFNDQNKDITIRFKCLGAMHMDPVVIRDFNKVVTIFNSAMKDDLRSAYMVKVERVLLPYFKNRGYPRINPNNYELEWWVSKQVFNNKTRSFLSSNLTNTDAQDAIETGD